MQDTPFQIGQKQVIQELEKQINQNAIAFSTVSAPDTNFDDDDRMCLTSVHFPSTQLKQAIQTQLIEPLKTLDSTQYYYSNESLHFTIKNIRAIANPPAFTKEDIEKAKEVFANVLSNYSVFNVYYYRLLLFPNNLALVGTTDPVFDDMVLELDRQLKKVGVPDTKVYVNDKFFFSNITLARFTQPITEEFKQKIQELSQAIEFEPYVVDSVTLLTANAVMKKRTEIKVYKLYTV